MKDSIENYVTKKLVSSDYLKNSRYRELYALTYPDGLTLLETTPQTYIKTSIDDLLHTVTAAETNRLEINILPVLIKVSI